MVIDDTIFTHGVVVVTVDNTMFRRSVDAVIRLDTDADLDADLGASCGQDDVEAACSGGSRNPLSPVVVSVCREMLLYLQAVKNNNAKQAFFHYRGAYRSVHNDEGPRCCCNDRWNWCFVAVPLPWHCWIRTMCCTNVVNIK